MKTLREVLAQAEHDSVAIRHFNVSDLVAVRAVGKSTSTSLERTCGAII